MRPNLCISSLLFSLALATPSQLDESRFFIPRGEGSFTVNGTDTLRVTSTTAASATATATNNTPVRHLLVGASGQLVGYDYDSSSFRSNPLANQSLPGVGVVYLAWKEPNILYAVDENSKALRQFYYCNETGTLSPQIASYNGSAGVVHLAFNKDKSRLVGSSYSEGAIDIWQSVPSGMLNLMKQIKLQGTPGPNNVSQTQLRAHQSVLDPSGRFFVVNDLGGDKVHVLDSQDDAWKITDSIAVTPPGSGPRHGIFLSIKGGSQATHYVLVSELANTLTLFEVDYSRNDTLGLKQVQTVSTFGPSERLNSTTARAGDIIVSRAGPARIYVTNRLSGNETDSISMFAVEVATASNRTADLVWKSSISTGGRAPRKINFSKGDQKVVFVANTNGTAGLAAFDYSNGTLSTKASATLENAIFAPGKFAQYGYGVQYVAQF